MPAPPTLCVCNDGAGLVGRRGALLWLRAPAQTAKAAGIAPAAYGAAKDPRLPLHLRDHDDALRIHPVRRAADQRQRGTRARHREHAYVGWANGADRAHHVPEAVVRRGHLDDVPRPQEGEIAEDTAVHVVVSIDHRRAGHAEGDGVGEAGHTVGRHDVIGNPTVAVVDVSARPDRRRPDAEVWYR